MTVKQENPIQASPGATGRGCGSAYEDYEKSHGNYDLTRLPVGAEQIVSHLQRREQNNGNLAEITLADLGCGTGMHLEYFQSRGLGQLIGVDASQAGIEKARSRLNPANSVLLVGDFRQLPLADASVDTVLLSFVIHHLPHGDQLELAANTGRLFAEIARVLKPDGELIIVTTTKKQLHPRSGSLWYYRYFQDAAVALARKFLPQSKLRQLLKSAGFSMVTSEPVEKTYWTEASLDETGPFRSEWRDGDSLFAFYRGKEELLQKRLKALERASPMVRHRCTFNKRGSAPSKSSKRTSSTPAGKPQVSIEPNTVSNGARSTSE